MSQQIKLIWLGAAVNSTMPLASPLTFCDLESQLPYGTLRVIDDLSAVGSVPDIFAEAAEVIAAVSDPENQEIIPWERIKRELKL